MEKINNILEELDKVLEKKNLDIFMLQLGNERMENEIKELKKQIALLKGEQYGE